MARSSLVLLRIALRDLRGSLSGLRIVLLCLALGVAAIGTVGGLRAAIQGGVAAQRRALLGGDLAIDSQSALPRALVSYLRDRGLRLSETVSLRTMLYGPGGQRMLVEARGVDAAYPLVGNLALSPAVPLDAAMERGVLVDPLIARRLRLQPEAPLRLGGLARPLSAQLLQIPDGAGTTALAPTVLLSRQALEASGLLAPGALITDTLRIALPDDPARMPPAARQARAAALARDLASRFADLGLRIRDVSDAAPGLTRVVDQVSQFMTLIGLASLLLGGLGVASGVGAWLQARTETLAVLRCLGASTRMIAGIVSLQLGLLCGAGILLGLLAGTLAPMLALRALAGLLPVAPDAAPHAAPLLLATGFGVLVTALFTLPPLLRAVRVAPTLLFREPAQPGDAGGWRLRTVLAALVLLLVGLAALTSPSPLLALGFCLVAAVVLGLFRLSAIALRLLALRAYGGRRDAPIWLQLALRDLHRPGTPAPALLLALGAGLTTLATIGLIEGNIRRAVLEQLPGHAPSFYFIDIQPQEAARFDAVLRALPAVGEIRQLPSLRARVVAVDGVPAAVAAQHASPPTRWALRGDRGLSLSAAPPPDTRIEAGAWWPPGYDGPPLLSMDANLARGWHVRVGSVIRLNVLGRSLDLKVANLRAIAWRSLQLNFAFIASPGLLSRAPHTLVATVSSTGRPDDDAAILQAATDALPGVTGIRVADVLAEIASLVRKLALALQAMGAVALLSGALVLAATLASGQRQRRRDAAILRCLGATSGQLRAAWLAEFAVLGVVAGVAAAMIGAVLSAMVLQLVLDAPWRLLGGTLAATLAGAIVLMLIAGLAATRQALAASPAELLRSD